MPLGPLAADTRIALDAFNTTGQWSWDYTVTNTVGRARTTIAKEATIGGDEDAPRVGNVRHLVLNPGGTVFENCGESSTLTPCFPYDNDADGISPPADCDDRNAAIKPAAPEVYDNAIDENCDGVADKRKRAASKLTLKRRGATYSGRLTSSSGECVGSRRVTLLRRGSSRKVAATSTAANGTFKIRRSRARAAASM